MTSYVVVIVGPGTVMTLVAAVMLTVFVVTVVKTVTGGRENLEVQKDFAAGNGEMREATVPRAPTHCACAAERLKAILLKKAYLVKCILIYRQQKNSEKM